MHIEFVSKYFQLTLVVYSDMCSQMRCRRSQPAQYSFNSIVFTLWIIWVIASHTTYVSSISLSLSKLQQYKLKRLCLLPGIENYYLYNYILFVFTTWLYIALLTSSCIIEDNISLYFTMTTLCLSIIAGDGAPTSEEDVPQGMSQDYSALRVAQKVW